MVIISVLVLLVIPNGGQIIESARSEACNAYRASSEALAAAAQHLEEFPMIDGSENC